MPKKILILIPDGPGLRNFAYTAFHQQARERGFEVIFWNMTPFDLKSLGYEEIKLVNPKLHFWTNIFKVLRIRYDIATNIRRTGDDIYKCYLFGLPYRNLKETLKNVFIEGFFSSVGARKGIRMARSVISRKEKTTAYFRSCRDVLRSEKPDLVFCTNQRTVLAIAPILAAQELKIPTATFIFSWDNLPKATMALEPDFYFVWSDYMKKELMFYYDYISEDQIKVTGTPQFEPHTYAHLLMPKDVFFKENNLDPGKRYICFSGDDVTTSPHDEQYLADLAQGVRILNDRGHHLGIVFRRCPVDFSDRYDKVLKEFNDVVVPVSPRWIRFADRWNGIIPSMEDLKLQVNTIAHTEFVVNLGSSMVFDYASLSKPCIFVAYDGGPVSRCRSVETIYKYVHFRSMPSDEAVMWVRQPSEFAGVLERALSGATGTVAAARQWFEIINLHPAEKASERILDEFTEIIDTHGSYS